MQYLKSFFISLIVLLFCSNMFLIYADDDTNISQKITVFDNADLLTPEQEEILITNSGNFSHLPIDIVFLTYNDGMGVDIVTYTDDFYDRLVAQLDYNLNGIMFTIDIIGREVYISTSENVVDWINDAELDEAIDSGYDYLVEGDYFNALREISDTALFTVEHWYSMESAGAFSYIKMVFLNSLWYIPILIIVFIVSRKRDIKKHNSANEFVTAEANIPKNSFKILNISDTFIRSYTTKTKVVQTSSGSSSSRSHRSGSSHRSSSGRRSGGRGRKF